MSDWPEKSRPRGLAGQKCCCGSCTTSPLAVTTNDAQHALLTILALLTISAYMFFSQDHRDKVRAENADASFGKSSTGIASFPRQPSH